MNINVDVPFNTLHLHLLGMHVLYTVSQSVRPWDSYQYAFRATNLDIDID